MAKSMRKGKIRPPQLRNHLVNFDEIWTLELSAQEHPTRKISFRSDNVGGISRVHVSPGSAETLIRRGGITNNHSIAYSLSNISAKNYQIGFETMYCIFKDNA